MQPLCGEALHQAVVEHAGEVEHGREGMARVDPFQCRGQCGPVRGVARDQVHPLGACGFELPHERTGLGGVATAPRQQHEPPRSVRADQVCGERATELAETAGDQHRAVRVEGAWQGQHGLMPSLVRGVLLRVAQGVRRVAYVEGGERPLVLPRIGGGRVSGRLREGEVRGHRPEGGSVHTDLVAERGCRTAHDLVARVYG